MAASQVELLKKIGEGFSLLTSTETCTPRYSIIIPTETVTRARSYLDELQSGVSQPGMYLSSGLNGVAFQSLTELDLLGKLIDTKHPQIFAESAVYGDGRDWNLIELQLLGDISIAMSVTIFDDGHHTSPTPHLPPFSGTLVFTPGALLRTGQGGTPADWHESTTPEGELSLDGYYGLYRRRLLPALRYINAHAARPRSAFVTIPGIGCGQFAGKFQGQLGSRLRDVLSRLLSEHGNELPNLKAVYFDPYSACENSRTQIHGISFMVRPLRQPGNQKKSQLCHPTSYAEPGDDFSECSLYSLVAWDHVSWPGNDFFAGSRATDDGVKAAATDSMRVLTGVEGHYDPSRSAYQPPARFRTWEHVVENEKRHRNLSLWTGGTVWK